jgi:hypothetical protein
LLPELSPRDADAPGQFAFADADRVTTILDRSGWREVEVRPVDAVCALPEDQLLRYVGSMGSVGRIVSQADEVTRARVLGVVRDAFDPFVHGSEIRFTAGCWLVAASRA